MLRRLKKGFDILDSLFEYFGLACLAAVVLVVLWQITSRELRGVTPPWSEESARILLIWIAFFGIAVGFREGIHISIAFVVNRLPGGVLAWVERFVLLVIFVFGLYLVVQGAQFTAATRFATLPVTGLPRSVLYVMMPVTGVMVCSYAALQAFGVRTEKHRAAEAHEDVE